MTKLSLENTTLRAFFYSTRKQVGVVKVEAHDARYQEQKQPFPTHVKYLLSNRKEQGVGGTNVGDKRFQLYRSVHGASL